MRPNMTASAPLSSSSLNLSPLGPRLKGPVQFARPDASIPTGRSEEHTSELQSQSNLVCRLLLEKKKAARLSYLGLGAQPPTPEWGAMLSQARAYLRNAWWMATFPGLAITLVFISLILCGDWLRDLLDPPLRT